MGCTQSKIDKDEAVSRCKNRKLLIKEALSRRNALAAAHSSYAISIKNTGAALNDFAHAEVQHHHHRQHPTSSSSSASAAASEGDALPSAAVPPPQATFDTLPPPPPPLPNFAAAPLQRAASMPEMKMQKQEARAAGPTTIVEDEEEEMELERAEKEGLVRRRSRREQKPRKKEEGAPPPTRPPPQMMHQQQDSAMEYFFPPIESVPAPTLEEPKEADAERNVYDEKAKRVEEEVVVVGEDGEEEEEERPRRPPPAVEVPVPAPAPEAVTEKKAVMKKGGEGGRRVAGRLNLIQIFDELDDHFLKASASAHEVSKMLEATRLYYHSNFADNRGHIDHSARLMRVITWNRSFKGFDKNSDDGKDNFDSEEHETHATVLDKMLAWEKKLYDEVKAGELMKFEYQKKVALLNKKKNRGSNSESLEKLKAAVSHLHTRYIVDMQSMDSTVSEINRLRDEQLYPKLVQLVSGMAPMWDTMRVHHEAQSKIAIALRSLDISSSPKETSDHHHERTVQLWYVVQEWHDQLLKLMDNQRAHINALNSWLKLNLIPIESSSKEKVSSPSRVPNPPIQGLLMAWQDGLKELPDGVGREAIRKFAATIHAIVILQEEEMKMKEKCEATRKELSRRTRQFEDWYNKYLQRKIPDEVDPERTEDQRHKDPAVEDRLFIVDQLKKQLEQEEEAYTRECLHVREKSLATLKMDLPGLFRAMSEVSLACSDMYRNLRSITQRQSRSEVSS